MIRIFIYGLFAVVSSAALAQSDCDKIGTRIFCRDGTHYETLGNRIYGTDGIVYERYRDTLYSSDGRKHERIGDKIYSTGKGMTHEKIGNTIYSSRAEEKSVASKILFEEDKEKEEHSPLFVKKPLSYEPVHTKPEKKVETPDIGSLLGQDHMVFLPE